MARLDGENGLVIVDVDTYNNYRLQHGHAVSSRLGAGTVDLLTYPVWLSGSAKITKGLKQALWIGIEKIGE